MAYIDSSVGTSPLSAAAREPPRPEPIEPEIPPEDRSYGRDPEKSLKQNLIDQIDDINLARDISPDVLDTIGQLVVSEYKIDETSRAEWKDRAEKAMKFATQESEPKQYPWPGASRVIFPLITQASIKFAAIAYAAIVQNRNVVKGIVWGSDKGTPATDTGKSDGKPKMHPDGTPVWLSKPGEKRQRADRIGEHMSWQLLDEMPEWEPQTDQLLHQIPIIGGAVRKTYRDPVQGRNFSLFVPLLDIVWNYHAPSFEAAPRHTEILSLYPHEIEEFERAEVFLPQEYGPGGEYGGSGEEGGSVPSPGGDMDAPHHFLEQHRRYDLDDDGYAEPYIVTVHQRSAKVVRIVARYDEDGISMVPPEGDAEDGDSDRGGGRDRGQRGEQGDKDSNEILRIAPVEHYTLIPFLPNPDGGSYPVGFGHLLRPLNEAINTSLNQMFDAGHLQNAGGGFISDQLSIASGPVAFQVGKYVRVGSKGQAIRDAVFPLPFQGPSQVLLSLVTLLITAGKDVASIQDILSGDAISANTSPTTVLALIEQGMKVYTAIHKRVYRAFKSEFAKLYRLNRLYLTDMQRYRVGDEWREVTPEDYRLGGGVEPIADPTMVTDMQKLGRAQLLLSLAGDPILSKKEVYTRLFDAANLDRIEELFAPPSPAELMMLQIALAEKQAELGRMRAQEQQYQTQALLNLAMARAKVSEPEVVWIEKQMDLLRLHIEATNTMVKAADVEARSHGAVDTSEAKNAAGRNARTEISPAARIPAAGDGGSGIPALAPLPDNGGVPAVPQGPGAIVPTGGNGPLGIGPSGPAGNPGPPSGQ